PAPCLFYLQLRPSPILPLFPYTTLFRSAGGFTTGGLNFDAKVRRQSTDKYDLFYGHIGAMDTMALALKIAARMIEDGELDKRIADRKSTRLNSSHVSISYAVFCLKKKQH